MGVGVIDLVYALFLCVFQSVCCFYPTVLTDVGCGTVLYVDVGHLVHSRFLFVYVYIASR